MAVLQCRAPDVQQTSGLCKRLQREHHVVVVIVSVPAAVLCVYDALQLQQELFNDFSAFAWHDRRSKTCVVGFDSYGSYGGHAQNVYKSVVELRVTARHEGTKLQQHQQQQQQHLKFSRVTHR